MTFDPFPSRKPIISGGLSAALLAGPDPSQSGQPPVLRFGPDRRPVRRADVLNLRDMRRIPTVREMHYVKVTGLLYGGSDFSRTIGRFLFRIRAI